jgi:predicted RNase H-like HicB family nuclease
MSCECYRIGGRFIAEDPECYEHGYRAKQRQELRENLQENILQILHDVKENTQTPEEALFNIQELYSTVIE